MHRHTRAYLVTGTEVFLWVSLFLKRFKISRQKNPDFCWRPRELSRKLVVLNLNWAHNSASFPYSPLPLTSLTPPLVLPQSLLLLLLLLRSVLAGCQKAHRLLWTPTAAPCNDQTSSCSLPWNIYRTEGTYSVSVGRELGTKVQHER